MDVSSEPACMHVPPAKADDLTEAEILSLFAGRDAWHLEGVGRLGIPPLQVADCGHGVTLVIPPYGSTTCFPTSVGMAATWNPELLREVGRALGREARAKGLGMLLGPMVNLHRLPCGGRNYESFSEDPVLAARLAAALVNGLQDEGTGACVKVFLCNNQQHDQMNTSAEVDRRTLEDLYLKLFRLIFKQCRPWAVMTSYNPVNGEYPSDSSRWIKEVLRKDLGFDGVVISDWNAIHSKKAMVSGLDIEMPGPAKYLTAENLTACLETGEVSWDELKERANRILDLHAKAGPARRGENGISPPELNSARHRELSRKVAEESIVLLKNDHAFLPLNAADIRKIAVIGPNAGAARLGGGGSASVSAFDAVTPLEGIRRLLPDSVEILYAEGCPLGEGLTAIPSACFAPPGAENFGAGLLGSYNTTEGFKNGHEPVTTQLDQTIDFSWGWAAPVDGLPRIEFAIQWEGRIRFPSDGSVLMGLSTTESIARVWLDDRLVLDCWSAFDENNFEDGYTNRSATTELPTTNGQIMQIRVEYRKTGTRAGLKLGWRHSGESDPISSAIRLAESADVAVVVAGLSNMFEGGMYDRESFPLPGRQVELIQRVATANPRTVVVLKNGTPVSLENWMDRVPAVLEAFYPGQEGGSAIARILFGEVNPSGRLPDTIPQSWEEVEAMRFYPGGGGKVTYGEGLMVGYRHHETAGIEPARPFGFGLGYSEIHYTNLKLSAPGTGPGETLSIEVDITNKGDMEAKETVQLYLEPEPPLPGQPAKELARFEKVTLCPGERRTVSFTLDWDDFLGFDPMTGHRTPRGPVFLVRVGPHSRSGAFTRVVTKSP
jgi:beta-glucosidase